MKEKFKEITSFTEEPGRLAWFIRRVYGAPLEPGEQIALRINPERKSGGQLWADLCVRVKSGQESSKDRWIVKVAHGYLGEWPSTNFPD